MKNSLREVVAESNVAAVAIALLLLWALDSAFRGIWDLVRRAAGPLLTAAGIPGISLFIPRIDLEYMFSYLYTAAVCLSAAALLSRWAYGVGPLRSLSECRSRLRRERMQEQTHEEKTC